MSGRERNRLPIRPAGSRYYMCRRRVWGHEHGVRYDEYRATEREKVKKRARVIIDFSPVPRYTSPPCGFLEALSLRCARPRQMPRLSAIN